MPLSFLSLPPLPNDALEPAPESSITLKTTTTAPTLLPVDYHYDTSRLSRCFLKPHVALGGGRGGVGGVQGGAGAYASSNAHAGGDGMAMVDHDVDHNGDHDVDHDEYEDYGGGFESWGNDNAVGVHEGGVQMVQAPARTGKVHVPYARRSKQVCGSVCVIVSGVCVYAADTGCCSYWHGGCGYERYTPVHGSGMHSCTQYVPISPPLVFHTISPCFSYTRWM